MTTTTRMVETGRREREERGGVEREKLDDVWIEDDLQHIMITCKTSTQHIIRG